MNKKILTMKHNLFCVTTETVNKTTIKNIKKAYKLLNKLNEIINNYGEDSEFVDNFYSISFLPFKKEMEKTMIF